MVGGMIGATSPDLRNKPRHSRAFDGTRSPADVPSAPASVAAHPVHYPASDRARSVHQQHVGGASSPVYTIGNLSTVWLIANVRETDAPLTHVGEPVEVHVLAFPGRVFKAKISWVAPSIDSNTHRLSVRADVENPRGELKPGMFANFSIITGEEETAPVLPQRAIVYKGDAARVWAGAAESD
jgi:multidrug efflux pump subunit AcrA (membrane-fusion protein)